MSQFEAMPIGRIDLLHRDHIGIQFADDVPDPVGIISPIPSDASVNIIGGEGQSHVTLAAPLDLFHVSYSSG